MSEPTHTDPYVERHGLPYDQLWRRTHLEMALIEREGRLGDLPDWRWESIHGLAERLLDEAVAHREAVGEEWNARQRSAPPQANGI